MAGDVAACGRGSQVVASGPVAAAFLGAASPDAAVPSISAGPPPTHPPTHSPSPLFDTCSIASCHTWRRYGYPILAF